MLTPVDERTPLLAQPAPPPLPPKLSPPPSSSYFPVPPAPLERPHIHISPPTPNPSSHPLSLPALARFAHALSQGYLPSSQQLLALGDLLLDSPLLEDDEPVVGVGRLSREGERVRLAARETVWSLRELVEGRNPVVKREKLDGDGVELVGETDEGTAGDGWQEFIYRCRENQLDIDIHAPHLPEATSKSRAQASSALLNLFQLFLTSPALRTLLSDLVLLVRDAADTVIEIAEKKDHLITHGASGALQQLVEGAAEKVVGEERVRVHDGKETVDEKEKEGISYAAAAAKAVDLPVAGVDTVDVEISVSPSSTSRDAPDVEIKLNGAELPDVEEEEYDEDDDEDAPDPPEVPPQVPSKSADQVRDAFVDRFKEILLALQSTPTYQRSLRTLLALLRSYLLRALHDSKPAVALHPAVPAGEEPPTPPETPPFGSAAEHGREDTAGHVDGPGDPLELVIPLLEPFTGGPGSLHPLRAAVHALLSHLTPPSSSGNGRTSPLPPSAAEESIPSRLSTLASDLDALISRALLVPGWLGTHESHRALSALYDSLAQLGTEAPALKSDAQVALSLALQAFSAVGNDALLGRAVGSVEELGRAVAAWAGAAGETAARAAAGEGAGAVLGDVVEWVVPRVLGVLKEVGLPRLEVATPAISLAIDPPSLLRTSFIPSSLSLQTSTTLTYVPSSGSSSQALPLRASSPASPTLDAAPASARTTYAASSCLTVSGLRLEVKEVGYYAQYKTGLPCFSTITESGLLDLHFGAHPQGGLEVALATTSSASASASSERTLFTLDKPNTHVTLSYFDLNPHQSSHPWLMWLARPALRKAAQVALEHEVKVYLERAAEWVGRVGWEVRERVRERERDERGRAMRGEEEGVGEVGRWVAALWDVLTGAPREEEPVEDQDEEEEEDDDDEQGALDWSLHMNRHGLAVDLERGPPPSSSPSSSHDAAAEPAPAHEDEHDPEQVATIGVGHPGVVLPPGSAPIPLPEGQRAPKGLARAAEEEVEREAAAVKGAARKGVRWASEVGEAAEVLEGRDEEGEVWGQEGGWEERRTGWRSEAFSFA
ncbi:hypothetical protein JCM10207_008237 [Rhodosporidiobolus poonsookiae]